MGLSLQREEYQYVNSDQRETAKTINKKIFIDLFNVKTKQTDRTEDFFHFL